MTVMRDQKVWFGGYNLTGAMNAIALDYGAAAKENTVLGNDTHTFEGGLKTVAASMQGYFDAAKDKVLFEAMAATGKVLSCGAAGTAGSAVYSFKALLGSYTPGGAVGEMFGFSLEAATEGKLVRGTIMENQTGLEASADGTGRQLGAVSSTQKLYAILHVLTADGTTPTLDVIIESDNGAGFGTPVTAITFDQITGIGSYWKEIDGPITDDYYRGSFTVGGTDPSFDYVLILAIA